MYNEQCIACHGVSLVCLAEQEKGKWIPNHTSGSYQKSASGLEQQPINILTVLET